MKSLSAKFEKGTVFLIKHADHFPFILIALPAVLTLFIGTEFFIRLLLAGFIIIAYIFFLVSKAKNKVIDKFINELNDQDIKIEATTGVNERLMEALDRIDKTILRKHGIVISLEKPKRTIN